MPKEDYLIKYLEKLGKVVVAMLGLKSSGKNLEAIEAADSICSEILTVSLDEVLLMTSDEFEKLLRKNNFNTNYLEKLGDLLVVTTDTYFDLNKLDEMKEISKKALILYRILNEKDSTFSFERESTIAELKRISNPIN